MATQKSSEIWMIVILVVGWAIWLVLSVFFVVNGDFEHVQRAGTLLISVGVVALAFFAPVIARFDQALSTFDRKIDPLTEETLLSLSEQSKLDLDDDRTRDVVEIVSGIRKLGGTAGMRTTIRECVFRVEIATVVVGTVQTGYGDKIAAYIRGMI